MKGAIGEAKIPHENPMLLVNGSQINQHYSYQPSYNNTSNSSMFPYPTAGVQGPVPGPVPGVSIPPPPTAFPPNYPMPPYPPTTTLTPPPNFYPRQPSNYYPPS
jgi:hypothetical protein